MSDQKRWFKVWVSVTNDPAFLSLPLDVLGRWTLLGAWMAEHGDKGTLHATESAIRHMLRIPQSVRVPTAVSAIPNVIISNCPVCFPHGHDKPAEFFGMAWKDGTCLECRGSGCAKCRGSDPLEEWGTANGNFTVIIFKWAKYQTDSTSYERLKRHRDKSNDNGVRGEEKRREEKERKDSSATPKKGSRSDGHSKDTTTLVEYWAAVYKEAFGDPPVVHWGKHAAIAKRLLAGRSLPDAQWMVTELVRNPPELARRNGEYDLSSVLRYASTLLARKKTSLELRP